MLVVFAEVAVDGDLQIEDALEDTAADSLARYLGEEAFDEVEPGRRGGDEVEMEARMALQPGHHVGIR